MLSQRELLSQLMGEADPYANDPGKNMDFRDEKVCKAYLAGCCPADCFKNSKLDRGGCGRIHSEFLKTEYEKEADKYEYGYLKIALEACEASVRDCDRKIVKTAPKEEEQITKTDHSQEIADMTAQMEVHLKAAEEKGIEGDLRAARAEMESVERIKVHISELKEGTRHMYDMSRPVTMTMCDVCGSILNQEEVGTQSRHFGGKIHRGFARMRDFIKKVIPLIEERRHLRLPPPMSSRDRRGSPSRSRDRRRRGRSESSRSRSKDRKKKSHKKRRSRSRDRRSRDRRSRSRDRRSRSRGDRSRRERKRRD